MIGIITAAGIIFSVALALAVLCLLCLWRQRRSGQKKNDKPVSVLGTGIDLHTNKAYGEVERAAVDTETDIPQCSDLVYDKIEKPTESVDRHIAVCNNQAYGKPTRYVDTDITLCDNKAYGRIKKPLTTVNTDITLYNNQAYGTTHNQQK